MISISDSEDKVNEDSDIENMRCGPPVIILAWIKVISYFDHRFITHYIFQNNTRIDVVLTPEKNVAFSLSHFKRQLGDRGIEDVNNLEVYHPRRRVWVRLPFAHSAFIKDRGIIFFLIRVVGVEKTHGIDDVFPYASCFPDLKGKEKAL